MVKKNVHTMRGYNTLNLPQTFFNCSLFYTYDWLTCLSWLMILIFGECRLNTVAAAKLYAQRYPNRRAPTDKISLFIGLEWLLPSGNKFEKESGELFSYLFSLSRGIRKIIFSWVQNQKYKKIYILSHWIVFRSFSTINDTYCQIEKYAVTKKN
jgi:hypothetical protein